MQNLVPAIVIALAVLSVGGCLGKDQNISNLISAEKQDSAKILGTRVAVLVEPQKNLPMRKIEDMLSEGLIDKGYSLVTRSDLDKVVKEIKFQQSAYASDDAAARVGRILNVDSVVVVQITDIASDTNEIKVAGAPTLGKVHEARTGIESISIGARAITVENASIQWSKTGEASRSPVLGEYVELVRGTIEGDLVDRAVADLLGQIGPRRSTEGA